jgi:hypothetical protein
MHIRYSFIGHFNMSANRKATILPCVQHIVMYGLCGFAAKGLVAFPTNSFRAAKPETINFYDATEIFIFVFDTNLSVQDHSRNLETAFNRQCQYTLLRNQYHLCRGEDVTASLNELPATTLSKRLTTISYMRSDYNKSGYYKMIEQAVQAAELFTTAKRRSPT